jgi:hypothetical protein
VITNPIRNSERDADQLRTGLIFAALMLAIPLGARLVAMLGGADVVDVAKRITMAMIGVYLMFTGNALPKSLIPLAGLRNDPIGAQIFRRFAGWTWTLTGLALAATWLLLTPARAGNVTLFIVPLGMLLIAVRRLTLPRPRPPLA